MSDSSRILAGMYSEEELEYELRRQLGLPAADPSAAGEAEMLELAAREREILAARPAIGRRDYEAYRLFHETAGRLGHNIPADLKAAWIQEDRRRKLVFIRTADEREKREALAAILTDSLRSAERAQRQGRVLAD